VSKLKDKVALITGGSSGIGRATSELFAREGARVIIASRRKEVAEKVVVGILEKGGKAEVIPTDVTEVRQVRDLMHQIKNRYGLLNILVNSAGINPSRAHVGLLDLSEEDWSLIIHTNLTGLFHCCKHGIPLLRESGGGSIVNISSILGLKGAKFRSAYMASKGGVTQLTKSLALEHATDNIRVNEVNPAFIRTPITEHIMRAAQQNPEQWKRITEGLHPLGRVGEPEEVAKAILFLASDDASFITGHSLLVDGGAMIKWG
jgi:NAD(P)-dependent dehydrogenase (short-subunit alcohol dehydrogenase family)